MFDEYVEHSGSPAGPSLLAHGLPSHFQGFEPTPYDADDIRAQDDDFAAPVDAPYPPDNGPAQLFELGQVQLALPARLLCLAVSSDTLALALSNNVIMMIELARPEQIIKLEIKRKTTEMSVHKIFMDPSGRHLIVTSTQGENWYHYTGWKRFKPLKGFKMVIESIAWNKQALLSSAHSTSSREFLVGARNGQVYEALLDAEDDFFKSQERYIQQVYAVPEKAPITGLRFDYPNPADARRVVVIMTTQSRIYQFSGNVERHSEDSSKIFFPFFAQYRDTQPKTLELPGNMASSELHFFTLSAEQAQTLPETMAWLSPQGIYYGTMNYSSPSGEFIESAQLLPYPVFSQSSGESTLPISMALTEFHFLLLYPDRTIAISRLDQKVAYDEMLPLARADTVIALASDPIRKTYWLYSGLSLLELRATNEDCNVWRSYLGQGNFDLALRYAKTANQRDLVLAAQADAYFDNGRYIQSAQSYAQCSASFESVVLKFISVGERDALRYYLISRLERTRKSNLTQRMLLATWLLEFYLSKCNELEDIVASESVSQDVENLRTERALLEDELRQFLETYKMNLDKDTVYELIQSHGRSDIFLHFATIMGDHNRVVEHWILEEEWMKAIDVMNRQTDLELYYRFGPVLMRHSPRECVDSWIRQPSLNPLRLVPSILRFQEVPLDPLSPNHAVRYLNHVIFDQHNTSSTIHNLMITIFANNPTDEGPLLRFLTSAPVDTLLSKPFYDLDYALRCCMQRNRTQACVHIYAKMGLWENSVDLALEKGNVELAKVHAEMPEDDQHLRKKLWLKIAKYVVQDKGDIKSAMSFLENTDLLKVEDILPFFPDFVVIDDFKEEICVALEGYSAHISSLKAEMDETTRGAEAIKKDITALRNRFITIDAAENCAVCGLALLQRQFYVFPCQHPFHADCLIGLAKEYLPSHALRRMLNLQTELIKLTSQMPMDKLSISSPTSQPITRQAAQRAALQGNIAISGQNGAKAAGSLGRNILAAGDKLRDLIMPESLATVVSASMWSTGLDKVSLGLLGGSKTDVSVHDEKRAETAREELDNLLTSACPLCESVVTRVDKGFVRDSNDTAVWQI